MPTTNRKTKNKQVNGHVASAPVAEPIRALVLFCGAGGSSWGAREAGIKIVAGFDMWDLAGKTHKANFPESEFIQGRLQDLDLDALVAKLGKIDLIIASPECTSHSPAKGNKPGSDESKDTAFEVVRFADAFKARWLVIENVVGMKRWGRYAEFKKALTDLGYKLREEALNAADFGVAQSRRRLFLTCDCVKNPQKVESRKRAVKNASEIVNLDGRYKWTPVTKPKRAEATLERFQRGIASEGMNRPFILVYYGSDHAGGWQQLNRPLRTITTVDRFALVKPDPENGHLMRMLQVHELQMAMGMPSTMKFEVGSRRDQIKMIGNAVCPPVMEAVILNLTGR